ncbi:MAG: polyamine aminopropyltransferase [SAR324 cluster bacterium]|nr:polyamine aminopropyltransferase [SAR324 cluster bacterium]
MATGLKITNPRLITGLLALSMLVVGITGISYEYTFSKLASDILGDSIRQWAITIGLMMLFMGIGADLQKHLSDNRLVEKLILAQIALGLTGSVGPTFSLFVFGSYHDFFTLVHYALISFVGFLIGLEIPLLTRINEGYLPDLKENLGLILKMDYIGSFIGALAWVYFFPQFFDLLETSYFLGLCNLGNGLILFLLFYSQIKKPWEPALLVGCSVVLIISMQAQSGSIRVALEQKLFKDPVVFSKTTPYQRLILTKKETGEVRLYINGHLQFSSSDEYIYHEFLVHPALSISPQAKRVLVLGGGDGLAVREILKYPQVEEITLIDLDPGMTDLGQTNPDLVALNGGSLKKAQVLPAQGITQGNKQLLTMRGQGYFRRQKQVKDVDVWYYNIDAFSFVQTIPQSYDVIILDFPDPSDINLSKLYSLEFYKALKERLTLGGLLIQQSTSPAYALEAFLMVGRTMEAAGLSTLALRENVPSFGQWGFWLAGHKEIYGNKGLQEKLMTPQIPDNVQYITPELLLSASKFGKGKLISKDSRINQVLEDHLFEVYRKAWLKLQ